MLFLQGDTASARRIQGAFVSEPEVRKVSEFLRSNEEAPLYETSITEPAKDIERDGLFGGGDGEADDELYEEAKQVVIESGKASASLLQRRLRGSDRNA